MEFHHVAQIGALGEQIDILQTETTTDGFVRFGALESVVRLTDDCLLRSKVAVAGQPQLIVVAGNLYDVRYVHHVATHPLEIVRLHRND